MGELELGTLAEKANAEHRACEQAARSAVDHAMNAGDYLEEVKASLPHGEFLPWLEENFEGSRRTASTYMRLSANRDALNGQHASHSIRGALKELSAPAETVSDEDGLPRFTSPEAREQVDVEEIGPDDIKQIVRLAKMQEFVVQFGDNSKHTVTRDVLLGKGHVKCPGCRGYGVVKG